MSSTTPTPSVASVIKAHLREQLDTHMAFRPDLPGGSDPIAGWALPHLEDTLEMLQRQLERRNIHNVASQIDELMERHGLPAEVRRAVGVGILETQVTVFKEAIRRARGDVSMFPDEEATALVTVQLPPVPPASPPAKPKASDLIEPFFARRADLDDTRHQVMAQDRATLRRFIEEAGDRPVDTYGRVDVTGFLDTMRRLPIHYGRSAKSKGVPLAALIAAADASDPRLGVRTIQRHLSALAQFLIRLRQPDGSAMHGRWTNSRSCSRHLSGPAGTEPV